MWQTFERRLEYPFAAAARRFRPQIEAAVASADQQALQQLTVLLPSLPDSEFGDFNTILSLMSSRDFSAAGITPETPTGDPMRLTPVLVARIERYDALFQALYVERERRSYVYTAGPANASPQKVKAYAQLQERYGQLVKAAAEASLAPDALEALAQLYADTEQLLHTEPVSLQQADLDELLTNLLDTKAQMLTALGEFRQAQESYNQAIARSETYSTAKADEYRLKLASLLLGKMGEFDSALQDVSGLLSAFDDREPSLAQVKIEELLASACLKIGDAFEARRLLEQAEADLTTLGYAPPDPANIDKSLAQWIDTADRTTLTPKDFLIAVLTPPHLYTAMAALPDAPAGYQWLLVPMQRIVTEVQARSTALDARDRQAVVGLQDDSPVPANLQPAQTVDLGALVRLSDWSDDLHQRAYAEPPTVAPVTLLTEVRAFEAEARRLHADRIITVALALQGDLLVKLERPDEALRTWRQVLTEIQAGGETSDALWILQKIAHFYGAQGDHAAVSSVCGEAITLAERSRYNISPAYLQSAYLQNKVQLYVIGVFAAYKLADYALMLRRAELSKARASLRAEMPAGTDINLDKLRQELRDLSSSLNLTEEELRAKRRALWDLLQIERTKAQAGRALPEFDLAAVQAALAPDELVLYYYWLGAGVLLVTALDRQVVRVTRQIMANDDYAELVSLIDNLAKLTEPSEGVQEIQLHAALLLPAEFRDLFAKKKRILFSPHHLLHLFPFHALKWQGKYVIEQFAVSYIPNLTSLLLHVPRRETASVLALGVKDFAVPGMTLKPLPDAPLEVDEVAADYRARGISVDVLKNEVVTFQRLREWAVLDRLSTFQIVHFATHSADVHGDYPMEAHFYLQNAQLDGLEIAAWELNAELVVLSACHSGQRATAGRGMGELPGDEIFGLQAAFFAAGAHRVLGALWAADSQTAQHLMSAFHRYLASGELPEIAWQKTVVKHLEAPETNSITKKPYYWAPFFITTMGRSVSE